MCIRDRLSDLQTQQELAELLLVSDAEVWPLEEGLRARVEEEARGDESLARMLDERQAWRDAAKWSFEAPFECGSEKQPATGKVIVLPPRGDKCARCWQYTATKDEEICARCADVLGLTDEEGEEDDDDGDGEGELSEEDADLDAFAKELSENMTEEQFKQITGQIPGSRRQRSGRG